MLECVYWMLVGCYSNFLVMIYCYPDVRKPNKQPNNSHIEMHIPIDLASRESRFNFNATVVWICYQEFSPLACWKTVALLRGSIASTNELSVVWILRYAVRCKNTCPKTPDIVHRTCDGTVDLTHIICWPHVQNGKKHLKCAIHEYLNWFLPLYFWGVCWLQRKRLPKIYLFTKLWQKEGHGACDTNWRRLRPGRKTLNLNGMNDGGRKNTEQRFCSAQPFALSRTSFAEEKSVTMRLWADPLPKST